MRSSMRPVLQQRRPQQTPSKLATQSLCIVAKPTGALCVQPVHHACCQEDQQTYYQLVNGGVTHTASRRAAVSSKEHQPRMVQEHRQGVCALSNHTCHHTPHPNMHKVLKVCSHLSLLQLYPTKRSYAPAARAAKPCLSTKLEQCIANNVLVITDNQASKIQPHGSSSRWRRLNGPWHESSTILASWQHAKSDQVAAHYGA